jgi:tripartite-type tricarboxylate transporter receptor subunit TctC
VRDHTPVTLARHRLTWNKPSFSRIALLAFVLSGAFCVQHARAQAYPNKPIRILLPYAAGGVSDVLVRSVNEIVSEVLGQPILIDNRPGASSQIALLACARAAPDGYTLCVTSGEGMSFGPYLFPSLPYDTERDFAPITNLVETQGSIVANKDAPYNSMKELIAYAKGRPGVVNAGSWGVASLAHIYLEWIKNQSGVDMTHVPYKGGGSPLILAMVAGDVHVAYFAIGQIQTQIKAGKVKVIAVTTPKRSRYFPNVHTLAEDGLDPGVTAWFGLFAPARTPRPIIDRLNAEYQKALRNPGFQERVLDAQAFDAAGSSPAAFAEFLKTDRAFSSRVVKLIGLRAETVDAPTKALADPASAKP